jgi:single-strand DNA-binding protein
MASVNKVMLIGNLCADPEIKSFQSGGKIANLRIATNEKWKNKQTGAPEERVEYHSVVLQSDGLAGVAERYLRKGSKVYIEGQLRTRKWQDKAGADRYSTEVSVGVGGSLVMLDGAKGDHSQREPDGSQGHAQTGSVADDLNDDVPFISSAGIW